MPFLSMGEQFQIIGMFEIEKGKITEDLALNGTSEIIEVRCLHNNENRQNIYCSIKTRFL
ncbi:hypothetical protein BWGOE2_32840 [Bacillus mycoides]|nr:hypothetical protein BWGOE2_32840 [Bacillus mycoides]OFD49632.1 hypothetical protein BWGOE1_09160 [Bacillus mycoides]